MGYAEHTQRSRSAHNPLGWKGERKHLKAPDSRFHTGTLVFQEGPNEPFRSLTMLDLWLSAKSKLQGGGVRK